MSKILTLSLLLVSLVLNADQSFATSWNYTVVGSVDDPNLSSDIFGNMVISDQPLEWGSEQPLETDSDSGAVFGYLISEWNIRVGQYSFSGQSNSFQGGGSIYQEITYYQDEYLLGDGMWFLGNFGSTNTQGDWNYWIGELVYFYDIDGTPYLDEQYLELAPLIKFAGLDYLEQENPFSDRWIPSFEMWLVRDIAPVPEPSTVLLLGSGLAGLAWYRRKRKKG